VVADAAVLRSFPSQVFGDGTGGLLTSKVEDALIEGRVPFQIIHDDQLDDLGRYRAVVLAGCAAMSDRQLELAREYVSSGGRLCVVGPAATHDEWMRPRQAPGLEGLPDSRVVRAAEDGDFVEAVRQALDGRVSASVDGPPGLGAEFTEQADRRLVHLVNYAAPEAAGDVAIRVRVPDGQRAAKVLLASPDRKEDLDLPFQQQGDAVSFTVPSVDVYEIAVVFLE
jgi:hypothetical protein